MGKKIEGVYQARDERDGVVYITRLTAAAYRTLYSSTGSLPNIAALTQEYRVELEDVWEGLAVFDGRRLLGRFQPKNFPPRSESDLEALRAHPLLFGQFEARLRADGSFAVVIEQYDGQSSLFGQISDADAADSDEMEYERIETQWVPSAN